MRGSGVRWGGGGRRHERDDRLGGPRSGDRDNWKLTRRAGWSERASYRAVQTKSTVREGAQLGGQGEAGPRGAVVRMRHPRSGRPWGAPGTTLKCQSAFAM